MELRDILNRLTEEELELLRDEIEGDLYEEIERVIDDKQQPSLFAQQFNINDTFIFQDYLGHITLYKITSARNPLFSTEVITSSGFRLSYSNFAQFKASEMMQWKKIDARVWDEAKSYYDNQRNKIRRIELEFTQAFENICSKYLEK